MTENFDRFRGTTTYIASAELRDAVNVAIALARPLLIKGEPGTGKTLLATNIAQGLEMPFYKWMVKSTAKAIDGLYVYDTVQRLNDSRFGDKDVSDIRQYIRLGPLGQAFASQERAVVLIDEIDKADLEFPNDLLSELDEMAFDIVETGERIVAKHRPVIIITSNSEKELPDPFLRRCVFHFIAFPTADLMEEIVHVHFPDLKRALLDQCIAKFYTLRQIEEFRKKPSTSELIDWIGVLLKAGITEKELRNEVPFLGVLLKSEQDMATYDASRKRAAGRSF
ncbi:MAG: MoxR family ATPase [Myxococcales bacterium]|nr:MAG: MoxR family ATPase [Myxococcales bacterium]